MLERFSIGDRVAIVTATAAIRAEDRGTIRAYESLRGVTRVSVQWDDGGRSTQTVPELRAAASLTREQAIADLVRLDVAKWGESERAASLAMRSKLSHGLALNTLAHYDPEHVDAVLAQEARAAMTPTDWHELHQGG